LPLRLALGTAVTTCVYILSLSNATLWAPMTFSIALLLEWTDDGFLRLYVNM